LESRSGRGVQYNVIKFVSDLRQVGGFLWVLQFPPCKSRIILTLDFGIQKKERKSFIPNDNENFIEMINIFC